MDNFQHAIDHFLTSFNSTSRYLKIIPVHFDDEEGAFVFRIILDIYDRFLDNAGYQSGENFVCPSEDFYKEIAHFAKSHLGSIPCWDNIKQIATVKVNIEDNEAQ